MTLQAYAHLHMLGGLVATVGLVLLLLDPVHARRWPASVGLFLMILSGTGQVLRLGYSVPPMWVIAKVVLWGILAVVAAAPQRFSRWGLLAVLSVLLLAVALSYVRPVLL